MKNSRTIELFLSVYIRKDALTTTSIWQVEVKSTGKRHKVAKVNGRIVVIKMEIEDEATPSGVENEEGCFKHGKLFW